MVKEILTTLGILLLGYGGCWAQDSDFKPNGAFNGRLYANFNSSLKSDDPTTGFEVQRAYFGYKYKLTPAFSMALKLDIGSPDALGETGQINRYAYFKTAAAYYKVENVTIGFGLQSTYQYKLQNGFWGRRYIYKNIAEGNSLGPSADIGLSFVGKWNEWEADVAFMNGEGYKKLQNDNSFKATGGITYHPNKTWLFRIYGDMINKAVVQSTYTAFVGYKGSLFNLALEGTMKDNENYIQGNQRYGYSIYGAYYLSDVIELFARYDYLESNIPAGDHLPWNLSEDGSAIISGVQYSPIQHIHIALNYQDWVPLASNMEMESTIFVNLEVTF
ncbi:hypothetical protein [Saccharicrinis fermentans]|uniref:Phosphate-selective porin n=1 Tax=Saccharicrinis fermentans DSM 9555 = JCM 21142 TaxID=869213 RepID=W7Y969_9BACT|nr:hypothetical protein [Saccharicrinis fermentans]GAF04862.1 phosphate-selective porin [Saccharicrinis fermentans DSM 9555 = JCM 21142]